MFTALHHQSPSYMLTVALGVDWSMALQLQLPSLRQHLPATVLVYRDDSRFVHTTLHGVVAQSHACRDASQRAGRIVHPSKLEFFLLRLLCHSIAQDWAPFPHSADLTSTDPPPNWWASRSCWNSRCTGPPTRPSGNSVRAQRHNTQPSKPYSMPTVPALLWPLGP